MGTSVGRRHVKAEGAQVAAGEGQQFVHRNRRQKTGLQALRTRRFTNVTHAVGCQTLTNLWQRFNPT